MLAGGVALNCVGNGKILREGPLQRVWIQPAAGDAGGALGAALSVWYQLLDNPRRPGKLDSQHGSLLGPRFETADIQRFLDSAGAKYRYFADEAGLVDAVRQAPGVRTAEGVVQAPLRLIGKDGKAIPNPTTVALQSYGLNWRADDRLNQWRVTSGRPPQGDHEVVILDRGSDGVGQRTGIADAVVDGDAVSDERVDVVDREVVDVPLARQTTVDET